MARTAAAIAISKTNLEHSPASAIFNWSYLFKRVRVHAPKTCCESTPEKEEKTEEEIQEEILKSLTDAPLNEDERAILKEILKHPKRRVQSTHIKKKTGLDQEVIRATLRNLVKCKLLSFS